MKDELLDIYLEMTVKEDMDAIHRSVDRLVDPTKNSINEKVSRIKSAFTDVVSDRIARFYYIDGPSGERKAIALDRDLVIFKR